MQTVYSWLNIYNAIIKCSKPNADNMDRALDQLFSSIIFPIGTVRDLTFSTTISIIIVLMLQMVVTIFWPFYWLDRELIYPKVFDQTIPIWLNHVWHSLPLASCATELLLKEREYVCFKKGFQLTLVFLVCYSIK
jgi:hypothetical protein